MGIALIKIKLMPASPETNLEEIKNKAYLVIEENKGKNTMFAEEPIAFGLKALIVTIALSEDEESETVEKAFSEIDGVSSVELIDYRRVVG